MGDAPELSVRERLRKARTDAGLTQKELASRLGVAHSTVSDAERGKVNLGAPIFIRWGTETNVSLDWLGARE